MGLRVGIDDRRIEPDDCVLVVSIFVFGDEDYAGENDAVGGVRVRALVVLLRLLAAARASAGSTAADVGGEEYGGEEHEEA